EGGGKGGGVSGGLPVGSAGPVLRAERRARQAVILELDARPENVHRHRYLLARKPRHAGGIPEDRARVLRGRCLSGKGVRHAAGVVLRQLKTGGVRRAGKRDNGNGNPYREWFSGGCPFSPRLVET